MAGSSDYPELVDNKTALQDGIDYIEADNVNNAYVPINKTQTFIGANGKGASWSTDILDYLANPAPPIVTKASGSTLSVSAGAVIIKNSGQTHRLIRRNTSPVTVTASDIDTGALADDTYYYLFAVADSAATTFTVKFSLSSTAPTGLTNFELIGWFFNQSAGALDVTLPLLGNNRARLRAPNGVVVTGATDITTSSTSYVDMTDMEIRFYCSGRPVRLTFASSIYNTSQGHTANVSFLVNGNTRGPQENQMEQTSSYGEWIGASWLEIGLAPGVYTLKVQWKVSGGTGGQAGATVTPRVFIAEEL